MIQRTVSTIVCGDFASLNDRNGFTMCISTEGDVYCFGKLYEEYAINQHCYSTLSLRNIKAIDCSDTHVVFLDENGIVFSMGSNSYGQLGVTLQTEHTSVPQQVNLPQMKQISCGEEFTICVTTNGSVYSFGRNFYGQLGLGTHKEYSAPQQIDSLDNVDFVECGGNHVFCKTCDNELCGWGFNAEGQLGVFNLMDHRTPISFSDLLNKDIIDIKCGYEHSLVLTRNGDVYSSGYNYYGQLGRKQKGGSIDLKKLQNFLRLYELNVELAFLFV